MSVEWRPSQGAPAPIGDPSKPTTPEEGADLLFPQITEYADGYVRPVDVATEMANVGAYTNVMSDDRRLTNFGRQAFSFPLPPGVIRQQVVFVDGGRQITEQHNERQSVVHEVFTVADAVVRTSEQEIRARTMLEQKFEGMELCEVAPRGIGIRIGKNGELVVENAGLTHRAIHPNNDGPLFGSTRAHAMGRAHEMGVLPHDMRILIPSGEVKVVPMTSDAPDGVIVAFCDVMEQGLVENGIAASRIKKRPESLDTYTEQAILLQEVAEGNITKAGRLSDGAHEPRQRLMHLFWRFGGREGSQKARDEARDLEQQMSNHPVYGVFLDPDSYQALYDYTEARNMEEMEEERRLGRSKPELHFELSRLEYAQKVAQFAPEIFGGMAEDMPLMSELFNANYHRRLRASNNHTNWREIATPEVVEQAEKVEFVSVTVEEVLKATPGGSFTEEMLRTNPAWIRSHIGLITGFLHMRLGVYYNEKQSQVMAEFMRIDDPDEMRAFVKKTLNSMREDAENKGLIPTAVAA